MWSKTKVGLTLGALVLAFGVGSVFAQETTQPTTDVKQHDKMFGMFKGHKGMHGDHLGKAMAPWENQELLNLLSLDATGLQTEFQAGKSLAEIAKAKGVAVEKVIELLVKQHEAQLETAVKDGKLTQEQATKMKEKMTERITSMVNNSHPKGDKTGKEWSKGKHHGFGDNEELLALLNLDAAKLQTELKAGKSLAEIAKAQGIAVEKVVELLVKQHETQLETAVKDGKLTQEQAAKMKEKMTERVTNMVNNTHREGDIAGKGWGKGNHHGFANNEELLGLLKLDADKLQTELKAGKSLAEIATAQGVTKEKVIEVVTKQFTSKLDEAVKAGKITQEKANELKEKQKDFAQKLVEKKFSTNTEKVAVGQ